jgi:hypothetical protein
LTNYQKSSPNHDPGDLTVIAGLARPIKVHGQGYNAEISAGSLLPAQSRRVASLLLSNPDDAAWRHAIETESSLIRFPNREICLA